MILCSFTSAHAGLSFTCSPEIGRGKEVVKVSIDDLNFASIRVNGSRDLCGKGVVKGEFVDYGEAELRIHCKKGVVRLIQNYDEMSLELGALKLGLSDTTFICN